MTHCHRFTTTLAAPLAVLLGCLATGCSSESEEAPGVLMLVLSTDMQVPKDFDEVLVEVQSERTGQTQRKLLAWPDADGTDTAERKSECRKSGAETKELRLPGTLGLQSRETGAATVTVTACHNGNAVLIRRSTIDQLPAAGDKRVPMLRVPVDWQCTDTDEAGTPPADCVSATVKASTLPTYRAEKVFGGASGAGSDGQCFDTLQAFDSAPALDASDSGCTLASVPRGSSLGLVKPPGTMGICGRAACFVPIDAELVDTWRDPSNPLEVGLPDPFCKHLSKGRARAVITPTAYPVKTESLPTCGAWSSVTSRPGWVEDPLPAAEKLLAQWNIDEGEPSMSWLDATYRGHDLVLQGVEYTTTRVRGRGSAARFDGRAYAALAETDSLRSTAFTLSAWVSFGGGDMAACEEGTTWPVVSMQSSTDTCVGYELAIRCTQQSEPSAVFSYGCDTQDEPQELIRALPKNSGKWTAGDWYHIAVTYDARRSPHAALFLDGALPDEPDEGEFEADLSYGSATELPMYVGTNAKGIEAGTGAFRGYLDDLIVFGRALEEDEVNELYSRSATVPGPSGFRWGTWDATGSVASLSADSRVDDLRVHVEDGACSSGGAVAHVGSDVLSRADTATLKANIPQGVWVEFGMSGPHGVPQCTWYREGQGEKDPTYEFDLKQPGWCTGPDCAIARDSMQTVTVSTHWKRAGSPDFGITGLEFSRNSESKASTTWDWEGLRYPPDNGEFCWRPVTYEPSPYASAGWTTGGWDKPEWPVLLQGQPTDVAGQIGSTAEVAAFVVGGALDLSQCSSIDVKPAKDPPKGGLELTIEDADGMSCTATLGPDPVSVQPSVDLNPWSCFDCASGGGTEAFASVRGAITRIAVRKPWSGSLLDPYALTIGAVQFGPTGCESFAE